jgi:hypothetical protein
MSAAATLTPPRKRFTRFEVEQMMGAGLFAGRTGFPWLPWPAFYAGCRSFYISQRGRAARSGGEQSRFCGEGSMNSP